MFTGEWTKPVGGKKPNELDIYDMSGNVCEWVWDWCDEEVGSGSNPKGAVSGSSRVNRGGCFLSFNELDLPVNYRQVAEPFKEYLFSGFRVVRRGRLLSTYMSQNF
ncbi:MAG TPA: SUMF1/EgtB/PvdO family nonheme iron enzyme [Spirochaetota bacterium]|nr:SUMF1/EgtB/PvdO family nonheme iron enzyme [Spirochaetota bacterium]